MVQVEGIPDIKLISHACSVYQSGIDLLCHSGAFANRIGSTLSASQTLPAQEKWEAECPRAHPRAMEERRGGSQRLVAGEARPGWLEEGRAI